MVLTNNPYVGGVEQRKKPQPTFCVSEKLWLYSDIRGGNPKETRLVSMPPNAEEWEKDVIACSLDPQLSVARRTSSCNNSVGRTVSFREGSFCDPVEIVMCDLTLRLPD